MNAPSSSPAVHRSDLPLPLLHRGKVREMYDAGENRLLMVASDRISAFDVVMDEAVPRKGEVLTMLTAWWLGGLPQGMEHHGLAADPDRIVEQVPGLASIREQWARRALLVRRTSPIPVECVVRGYLSGSAWREYRDHGTLAGEPLPPGLIQSERLPSPIFSPATKAEAGHDENITFDEVVARLGSERAETLKERSLALYATGAATALQRGIILADTKFEFGVDDRGRVLLIDEVLTPDSSRYWPEEEYAPGSTPPSLDKQPVRDYLFGLPDWDRSPPPPPLPPQVVEASTARYLEAFRRLTGIELDEYKPPDFNLRPREADG
ncbi:MAG: phosphoribosylaminoimidazolesuccinocarboxamide synthase [Gemmatimonadota bacterium]